MGVELLHFVAQWAEGICAPHRDEVVVAARRLGASIRECDYDQSGDLVRSYKVLNVPAVAVMGSPESLIVGAVDADGLVDRLRPFIGLSAEIEARTSEMFPIEAIEQAREILMPIHDDRVLQAVLTLSDGNLERLRHFTEVAAVDYRDVLAWAETPRQQDEPSTYEELRRRLNLPPDP